VTDALTKIWHNYYDSPRPATQATDPYADRLNYSYDSLEPPHQHQRLLRRHGGARTTPPGLTSSQDQNGKTTDYTYDNAGRVKTMTTPTAARRIPCGSTAPTDGNQTTVTDPLTHVTTDSYDGRNRLTQVRTTSTTR